MKRILAILITGLTAALAFLYWGDPQCYGWICAAAGWIDKCFKE